MKNTLNKQELNECVRNTIFLLLRRHQSDGFVQGIPIDGVKNGEQTRQVCDRLVELHILQSDYKILGRNKFEGNINFNKVKEVIEKGNY